MTVVRVATVTLLATTGAVLVVLGVAAQPRTQGPWALGTAAALVVGALLSIHRPRHPLAWLVLASGLVGAVATYGFTFGAPGGPPLAVEARRAADVLVLANTVGTPAAVFLLFPDGRPASRRWRPVLALLATTVLLVVAAELPSSRLAGLQDAASGLLVMLLPLAGLSAFRRFRRARHVERQQLKWLAYAAALFVLLLGCAVASGDPEVDVLPLVLVAVGWSGMPLAIGVGLLRHNLWDIDRLIRRTALYTVVTASQVAVWATSVVLLQRVLPPVAGPSDLGVSASTLLVAAAFQPVRRIAQRMLERRFGRRRYDAERTLGLFGSRLRDAIDPELVVSELMTAVQATVQPSAQSVWTRPTPTGTGT